MPACRVTARVERIVLVVLDGLRPDAIDAFGLDCLAELAQSGASTLSASTVSPSVTACAMASLLTGATPARHGCQSDQFRLPRPRGALHPLPRVLAQHGLASSAFLTRVPFLMRPVARRLANAAGVSTASFRGTSADEVLAVASHQIRVQQRGLLLLHWPDGDRAGHAYGWMSRGYAMAARAMDRALGQLIASVDLRDASTLLIVVADHGGGGTIATEHNSTHELDCTIPIVLAGAAIVAGDLGPGVSLLDVPATILYALGITAPESYGGRALVRAFEPDATTVPATLTAVPSSAPD